MEKIKLKFHKITSKVQAFYRKLKSQCVYTYHKVKLKIKMNVYKFERKHGYALRCEWCEDNIFCDTYQAAPIKRQFWEILRCKERASTK